MSLMGSMPQRRLVSRACPPVPPRSRRHRGKRAAISDRMSSSTSMSTGMTSVSSVFLLTATPSRKRRAAGPQAARVTLTVALSSGPCFHGPEICHTRRTGRVSARSRIDARGRSWKALHRTDRDSGCALIEPSRVNQWVDGSCLRCAGLDTEAVSGELGPEASTKLAEHIAAVTVTAERDFQSAKFCG